MRKSLFTVAACLLLGAMLLVPFAALAGEDDTVIGWRYDNYTISDLTNGTVDGTQLKKQDGTKDMISWNEYATPENGATVTLENGELTFAGASIWNFQSKLNPAALSENAIGYGPVVLGFDTYFGAASNGTAGTVKGYFQFLIDGISIFRLNRDYGHLYYGETWTDFTGAGNRQEGWYTIEMIFVPQDANGAICTTEEQTVAKNTLYLRLRKASETVESIPTSISPESLEKWYQKELPSQLNGQMVNLAAKTMFGTGEKGSCTIRRPRAANLTPCDTTVTFEGFDGLTQFAKKGDFITLPTANGAAAWGIDGRYWAPGSSYKVVGDTTFTPLSNTTWNMTSCYDSAALWGSSDNIVDRGYAIFHYNDDSAGWGWTPVISWSKGSDYGSYSYDKTQQAITIDSYGAYKNCAQWYLARPQAKLAGTTHFAMSYQVWYTAGDFDGMNLLMDTTTALTATTAGKVTMANGTELGNLQEGWNTVRIYILPNYDTDGTTVKNFNFHVSLNSSANDGDAISDAVVTALPYAVWNVKSITNDSLLRIRMIDSAATPTAPTTIKLRGFKTYSLTPSYMNYVSFGRDAEMLSAPLGESITLPVIEEIELWSDGVHTYSAGSQYTPTSTFTEMTPVLTDTQKAYKTLEEATEDLKAATGDAVVFALDDLVAAMNNPLLDTSDSRYQAAVNAKTAAVKGLEGAMLAPIQGIDTMSVGDQYTAIQTAVQLYQSYKAYVGATAKAALQTAIDSYNNFADSLNGDVKEMVSLAFGVTDTPNPLSLVRATLRDIKSKIEE